MKILYKNSGELITIANPEDTSFLDHIEVLDKLCKLHLSRLVQLIKNNLPVNQANQDIRLIQEIIGSIEIVSETKSNKEFEGTLNCIKNFNKSNLHIYMQIDKQLHSCLVKFNQEISNLSNFYIEISRTN